MKNKTVITICLVAVLVGLFVSPAEATDGITQRLPHCKGVLSFSQRGNCPQPPQVPDTIIPGPVERIVPPMPSAHSGEIGHKPDPELSSLPYHYLQVLNTRVPLYVTLDDAVRRTNRNRSLIPGFDYVSFNYQVKVKGKWFYRTVSGFWMSGKDASYLGSIPSFQGLEFDRTPEGNFGWVLMETESVRRPGSQDPPPAGSRYQRFDVVRVTDQREVDGIAYLKTGKEEWLPAGNVAIVELRDEPPEGVDQPRWIDVNLEQQTLAVYESGELAFATVISSGVEGNWTRPGTFEIKTKLETELMRGSFAADRSDYYYLENVPWTMYFDESRALHGTYWHDDFGRPQSKGCVNLSPGDAHWIFKWAEEGDFVHVYDPSGETPTDPDLFHSGGA